MKKRLGLIITIIIVELICINKVFALDASITKDTFTWNDIDNYELNKLKCDNVSIISGDITSGNVLRKKTGSIKFSSAKNSKVTCTIYLSKELTGNDKDVEVISRTYGNSNIKPSQQQTTIRTTTVQQTQPAPKSNNANIKSLSIKGNDDSDVILSPEFNPNVYDYEATVNSAITNVQIIPILDDSKSNAVLSNNAYEQLKAGEDNRITITVTAEDGTKKAYVINVKREALTSDATLSSLIISECNNFKFNKDKFMYDILIGKKVDKLTLNYQVSDTNSTVEIEGNSKLKDGSVVKIIVKAQDGSKKLYTLNINKKINKKEEVKKVDAEKNPLIILALSMISFSLVGGILYFIKK